MKCFIDTYFYRMDNFSISMTLRLVLYSCIIAFLFLDSYAICMKIDGKPYFKIL